MSDYEYEWEEEDFQNAIKIAESLRDYVDRAERYTAPNPDYSDVSYKRFRKGLKRVREKADLLEKLAKKKKPLDKVLCAERYIQLKDANQLGI